MAMIHVYGIGPGNPELILTDFEAVSQASDLVIGSQRQLAMIPDSFQGERVILPKLKELMIYLNEAIKLDQTVTLLASGDPMYFGIGSFILRNFSEDIVTIHPGISSVQYLFSKTGVSMNDSFLTSSHGRIPNYDKMALEATVGMVTDDVNGPFEIAQALLQRGVSHRKMYIGENLSYSNEVISAYELEDVPKKNYDMNVVIIKDEG